MEAIQALSGKIAAVIINPLIALIFGVGLLVFVWGLVKYLYAANVQGKVDSEAQKHMIWGVLGMFIMVAAFTIIRVIANTIGADLPAGY